MKQRGRRPIYEVLTTAAYDILSEYALPMQIRTISERSTLRYSVHQFSQAMKRDSRFKIMVHNHTRCQWGLKAWSRRCKRIECDRYTYWRKQHCSSNCSLKTLHEKNVSPQTRKIVNLISEGWTTQAVADELNITRDCVWGACSRNGGVRAIRGDPQ